MDNKLAKALDECITRIDRGESIESCLSDYPELAGELRPLLHMSTLISKAPPILPSESFWQQSKARVLAHIRQPDVHEDKQPADARKSVTSSVFGWKRVLIPVVSLVAVLVVGLLFPGLWSTTTVLANPCTLSVLSGDVELQDTASDAWVTGTDGSILDAGHRIRTDEDSYAVLTFFDGSTIELEPGSTVEIEEIKYTKDRITGIAVKQLGGVTWSHVLGSPEPGSHFRVNTPSAEIDVQNTLFTVEVDETGATKVAVTEGSVTVSALKQRISLSADQQTEVDVGSAPAQPVARDPTLNKLLIAVELPGVCSLGDPNGLSTGYLPNGVSFNQIKDSRSELLPDGRQLITIPQPRDGIYVLAIRNIGEQSVKLNIRAVSEDGVVLDYRDDIGGVGDGDKIVFLNIAVGGRKLTGAEVVDIRSLVDNAPEKLVVTDLAIERALSIKATIEAAVKPQTESDDAGNTVRPSDGSTDNTTTGTPDTSPDIGTYDDDVSESDDAGNTVRPSDGSTDNTTTGTPDTSPDTGTYDDDVSDGTVPDKTAR